MNTFHLIITAYNALVYNGDAVYCGLVTSEGALGIEARHESMLSVLKMNSNIDYEDSSGNKNSVSIKDGFFSFKQNKCTIAVSLQE